MTFTFKTKRGAHVYDDTRSYAESRLAKLDRYFKHDTEAHVLFDEDKENKKKVEVTIKHGSMIFRATASAADYNAAIVKTIDIFQRQIHKNKTRLEKRLHTGAFDDTTDIPEEVLATEDELDIIRKKSFILKPMTPEDAILQMNMLNHQFYIFRDSENDDRFSVVYIRNDGGYGLIEAE